VIWPRAWIEELFACIKPPLATATAAQCIAAVQLFALFVAKMHTLKTKQFRVMVFIGDIYHELFKEPVIGPLKFKMAGICSKNRQEVIFLPFVVRCG